MTIQEYMEKNNETYRSLGKKIGVSHTYLWLIAKHNECISGKLANKIRDLLPEIDIVEKSEGKYYLGKER